MLTILAFTTSARDSEKDVLLEVGQLVCWLVVWLVGNALIIDARGASITYGDLGGVVCSSSSSSSP